MILEVSFVLACAQLKPFLVEAYSRKHLAPAIQKQFVLSDDRLGNKGRTVLLYAVHALQHRSYSQSNFVTHSLDFCVAASEAKALIGTPRTRFSLESPDV